MERYCYYRHDDCFDYLPIYWKYHTEFLYKDTSEEDKCNYCDRLCGKDLRLNVPLVRECFYCYGTNN